MPPKTRIHFQKAETIGRFDYVSIQQTSVPEASTNFPCRIFHSVLLHCDGCIGFPGTHSNLLFDERANMFVAEIINNVHAEFFAIQFFLNDDAR